MLSQCLVDFRVFFKPVFSNDMAMQLLVFFTYVVNMLGLKTMIQVLIFESINWQLHSNVFSLADIQGKV